MVLLSNELLFGLSPCLPLIKLLIIDSVKSFSDKPFTAWVWILIVAYPQPKEISGWWFSFSDISIDMLGSSWHILDVNSYVIPHIGR